MSSSVRALAWAVGPVRAADLSTRLRPHWGLCGSRGDQYKGRDGSRLGASGVLGQHSPFGGFWRPFLRTGSDRVRLGKNKSKTRTSNKIKYWGLIPQMRDEQEMEQIRILAENHWESEMPRNVYGPWGTKVSVKEWGS